MSDDLAFWLRNTPNWVREECGGYKDGVKQYDRSPFEAADRIEELEAKLAKAVDALEQIATFDTRPAAYFPDTMDLARTALAELKGNKQ